MYICRLFHRDRPAEQIDARLIAAGALTLGRDPAADWPLDDPDGLLSRIHCTLSVADGALLVSDSSTNGTFVDGDARVPPGAAVPLRPSQTVRLGSLTLLVDRPPADAGGDATLVHLPAVPRAAWDAPAPAPRHADASLLEAFCEGARLDVSSFSDEDPVLLMRRLGGIYRETVVGLSAIIAQRTQMKQAHELDRTTVRADANNPVKWTAPRALADDLLRDREGVFLSGEAAIRASFDDLSAHVAALADGVNGAIAALLDGLDPDALGTAAAAQGFSLKGRAATQVAIHAERHRALRDGGAAKAFRAAYIAGGSATG